MFRTLNVIEKSLRFCYVFQYVININPLIVKHYLLIFLVKINFVRTRSTLNRKDWECAIPGKQEVIQRLFK